MPHKIRSEDSITWKHTSVSFSYLGEQGNGIIDIGPKLVLAIQKYIEVESQSAYVN